MHLLANLVELMVVKLSMPAVRGVMKPNIDDTKTRAQQNNNSQKTKKNIVGIYKATFTMQCG